MRVGPILVLLLMSIAYTAWGFEALDAIAPVPPDRPDINRINGITLAPIEDGHLGDVGYGSASCATAVAQIAEIGANWISITPFGRMDDLESTDILHDFEIPVEKNEEMIRSAVAQARLEGLKVAIIPHIYVMSGQWRGEIDPGSDPAWDEWFESYTDFIMRFAALGEEVGADLFSVGVEFKSSTNFRPHKWRALIDKVREVYRGPLTYSANWDEVDQVPFWDALDMIGVNAFWPLATRPGDGYTVMRQRARQVALDLEALFYFWGRPVLFTEVGVKSASDSALAPWEWPENCSSLVYDEEYQADAYQAVFEAVGHEPWFEGMFIWKYYSDPYDETQETITGFSPKNKLAEDVLVTWFGEIDARITSTYM